MKPQRVVKGIGIVVFLVGVLVCVSWIVDLPALRMMNPDWITMKFTTALCFVFSGVLLFVLPGQVGEGEYSIKRLTLMICSLELLGMMGIIFIAALLGTSTGIEVLFVSETHLEPMTTAPGMPAVASMVALLMVSAVGMLDFFNPAKYRGVTRILGIVVAAIGALAVVGYITGVPLLYYYVATVATALAPTTAILFVLLGVGIVLNARTEG